MFDWRHICRFLAALSLFAAIVWAGLFATVHTVTLATPSLVLAGVAATLASASRVGQPMRLNGAVIAGIAFFAYLLARALTSEVIDLAMADVTIFGTAGFAFLAMSQLSLREKSFWIPLIALVLLAVVNAVVAALQVLKIGDFVPLEVFNISRILSTERVTGIFMHYNHFAGFLAAFGAVVFAVMLLSRSWGVRILSGLIVAVITGLIALSLSRGGMISLGIGFLVVYVSVLIRAFLGDRGQAYKTGLMSLGVVMVAVVFIASRLVFVERAQESVEGADVMFASNIRLALAAASVAQFVDAPLVGAGGRSFSYLCFEYLPAQKISKEGDPEFVHNDHLQLLAEYGAMGYVLFLVFLGLVIHAGVRALRQSQHPWAPVWIYGGVAIISGVLVHAFVEFNLHIVPIALMAAVVCGALAAATPIRKCWAIWGIVMTIALAGSTGAAAHFAQKELRAGLPLFEMGMGRETSRWEPDTQLLDVWVDALGRSLEVRPEHRRYQRLGICHTTLAALATDREEVREQLLTAIPAYEAALERNPHLIVSRLNLAQAYEDLGQLDRALEELVDNPRLLDSREFWFRGNLRVARLYHILGNQQARAGQAAQAAAAYEKSLEHYQRSFDLTGENGYAPWMLGYANVVSDYVASTLMLDRYRLGMDAIAEFRSAAHPWHFDQKMLEHKMLLNIGTAHLDYADRLWKARRAPEALAVYLQAHEELDAYRVRVPKSEWRQVLGLLKQAKEKIEFLEGARISPQLPMQ